MSQMTVPWVPRQPRSYRGLSGLIVRIAVLIYRIAAVVLRIPYVPAIVFFGGVGAVVVGVWAHMLLFEFLDGVAAEYGGTGLTFLGMDYPLSVANLRAGLPAAVPGAVSGVAASLLWPLQFALVRDLIGVGAILGFISVVPIYGIWWERKVAARIQSRMGPMRVGLWHGWAQSFADGIKLIGKEDLIPEGGDKALFILAPYFAFVSAVCAFIALPFGTLWVFRELDVALIFILAMMGIEVIGIILAGWASNNKWSIYGAMREACQMVSYEIPMGMALLIPVMCAGTLSLTGIVDGTGVWAGQSDGWFSWLIFRNPFTFIAFFCYYIASLASCKRAPFDLPESESELVAGFHTEYSGFRWSLFFFAEYAAMFVVAGLAVILFLGGWHSPLPARWGESLLDGGLGGRALHGVLFNGPLWFVGKSMFLYYVQIWLRWTLPRIRIDQVLYACFQVLLPIMMVLLLGTTFWEIAIDNGGGFARVVNGLLGLVGVGFVVAFVSIMLYGWYHRWRLVGTLGVEQLPGA